MMIDTETALAKIIDIAYSGNTSTAGNTDELIHLLQEFSHLFVDGIKKRLKDLGCSDDILLDDKKLIGELKRRLNTVEALICGNTVDNWIIAGKTPQYSTAGRTNVYKLCFALEMNEKETVEFFCKCYLDRPFNFKRAEETIYYFCLKNRISYKRAYDLYEIVKRGRDNKAINEVFVYNDLTNNIADDIMPFSSDDELLQYLSKNIKDEVKLNSSARRVVDELVDECIKKYEKVYHYELTELKDSYKGYATCEHILRDFFVDDENDDDNETDKNIRKSIALSENFKSKFKNVSWMQFPYRQTLQNIKANSTIPHATRFLVIMLCFYHLYAHEDFEDENSAPDVEEFEIFTNKKLNDGGFDPLYPKNPLDILFYYSSAADTDQFICLKRLFKMITE